MRVHYRSFREHKPSAWGIFVSFLQAYWNVYFKAGGIDDTRIAGVIDSAKGTREGTISLAKAREMVQSGELASDDLVDLGKGWRSVDQIPELDDCKPRSRSDRWPFLKVGLAMLWLAAAWRSLLR